MSESRSSTAGLMILVFLVAVVAVGGLAVWLIGSEFLRTLALILIVAVAVAVVIGASALPIRAWKRRDYTGDHYHHDGTKTIVRETKVLDGRAAPQTDVKLLQLPAAPQGMVFPDLLRGAMAAGALQAHSGMAGNNGYRSYTEVDLPDLSDDSDGWDGDITV